jgi:hypothetical protein
MSVNITLRENFAYSESLTSVGPCRELPFITGDGFHALPEVLLVSFPSSFLTRKKQ